MTPERQAYLAKCSKREVHIRDRIALQKSNIKAFKADFKNNPTRAKNFLQVARYILTTYRHELARFKRGKVVKPVPTSRPFLYETKEYPCACGCCSEPLTLFDNYCPNCGRYILWNEVKV